jgi:acyl-CoA reductase-like NAD-dependent aldehyde dehydrogenase
VAEPLAERNPATGELLGTVPAATAGDVEAAVALAARVQPLWASVPIASRARALRRAAQAVLDEVDDLAGLLARETGRPRTEVLLTELLPSVSGLHALADAAPGAVGDRRLGARAALGRRTALVQAPYGVVGVRAGATSPWVEPLLEVAAAVVAGNAVVLVPSARLAADHLRDAFVRAGVPAELIAVAHGPAAAAALAGAADTVDDLTAPPGKGTMLVLAGAPLEPAVAGALWGAFAGGGRHPAAVGRVIVVPSLAGPLTAALAAGARRLRVGDPEDPDTEIGPMPSREELERVESVVAAAEAAGAERLCGGPLVVPGLAGAFFAPAVLRGVDPVAQLVTEPPPGPVLAVVEAPGDAAAIALAQDAPGAVSVWAGDRDRGERIARGLRAELVWINDHGTAPVVAPVRLARQVRVRQLASRTAGLRSARWLPYDPALVRASVAVARLMHGRESERGRALRHGIVPLTRTFVRLAREARR